MIKENQNYNGSNIEGTIFHEAFLSDSNLSKIYQELFPDERKPSNFKFLSLENAPYNPTISILSFMADFDLVVIEAISHWNIKELVSLAKYTLNVICQLDEKYGPIIPYSDKIRLIILCTDEKERPKSEYHIFDALKTEYNGDWHRPNWKVKVISKYNENVPQGGLIEEHFNFYNTNKNCSS